MEQFNCEGLESLSLEGMTKIEGGQIIDLLKAAGKTLTVGYFAQQFIDDWDNIKAGFWKGINDFSRP
jgi:hypothetical protein